MGPAVKKVGHAAAGGSPKIEKKDGQVQRGEISKTTNA